MGVLIAVEGELEGDVFRVPDGENLIGRDKQCSIVVPSEWISRTHAKLVHRDGLFVVAPMSDKNPTFVNDERTEGTELKDGDFLKLGKTTFRFRTVA
jgi:pSer/pThr/pTyr-binding forkhead associated (FHA) protein